MSETQVDLIREAFEFYDKNNKGRFRAADTVPVLRALGIPVRPPVRVGLRSDTPDLLEEVLALP